MTENIHRNSCIRYWFLFWGLFYERQKCFFKHFQLFLNQWQLNSQQTKT